jgi:predicted HTH transcriptional regulator
MDAELKYLINAGEGESLDYKQSISSAAKIAKTMSAFANHKGGILLIGVRDNQTICGVKSEDEKYMLELASAFYCKPGVPITVEEFEIGNKIVIKCTVAQGEEQPYYAKDEEGKWWVYMRVKDQSLLASKTVVDVLKRNTSNEDVLIEYGKNEKALLAYFEINHRITLSQFQQLVNISKKRASKIMVNMISAGVIRSHTYEKTEFFTLS